MRAAIMQPYFLPYLGYFQLMKSVDIFILADEYQYTNKGWINRNRAILNNKLMTFTIPVSSDGVFISDKKIHNQKSIKSLHRKIKQSYCDSPNSQSVNLVLEDVFQSEQEFLFPFIDRSIASICELLAINTQMVRLSELDNNKNLKGVERVIDIVKVLGADTYLNPEGGRELYKREEFNRNHLELEFLEHIPKPYPQLIPGFIDRLSIIDLLYMNNNTEALHVQLNSYQTNKSEE